MDKHELWSYLVERVKPETSWDRQVMLKIKEKILADDTTPPEDEDIAKQRWFDTCGEAVVCQQDQHDISIEPQRMPRDWVINDSAASQGDCDAADVLVSRANALRGVGRPEAVPELLRVINQLVACDPGRCCNLSQAFDAIAYEPEGE